MLREGFHRLLSAHLSGAVALTVLTLALAGTLNACAGPGAGGGLIRPATQREWISYPGSGGFSASDGVSPAAYPDPARRDIAKLLSSGRRLCFSASDVMPSDVSTALDNAVLAYLTVPAALTSKILPALATVPAERGPVPAICG